MKRIYAAIGVVALLLLAVGCRGKKDLTGRQPVASEEVQDNFETLMESYPDWETFSAKGSADLSVGAGSSLSASTQVRMIRGEMLQVSVRVILGIEVARLYMTADSIFLINKMQKQMVAESLTRLGEKLSNPVSLETVQDALLGRIFLLDSPSNRYHLSDFEVLESGASRWSLTPREQDSRFGYRFDLDGTRLLTTQLISTGGSKKVVCEYSRFIEQSGSENFPTMMTLSLTGLNTPIGMNLKYDSSSVTWNGSVKTDNLNLSRYTRVSAAQMLKLLSL